MLKSINYWSYPGGLEGLLPVSDFLRMAREDGFEAVEICFGGAGSAAHLEMTEAEVRAIAAEAASLELQIPTTASGLYWEEAIGDYEPASRAEALHELKMMLRMSSWLGAKTHLTIAGAVDVFFLPQRAPQSYADVWRHSVEGLREAAKTAAEVGVRIGIENVWNKFLLSPMEMRMFLDEVGSEWVGSYLDVGNVLLYGYPEHWVEVLGSRIFAVHLKDFRRAVGTAEGFVDLLEGDVNWPAVMSGLRAAGYTGPLTAELIPGYKHHGRVRVQNAKRAMDAIVTGSVSGN